MASTPRRLSGTLIEVGDMLPEDIRQLTIKIAHKAVKKASAGVAASEVTWRPVVDYRYDVPFEAVKPFGRIEAIRRSLDEVVDYIYTELLNASPHLSGDYQDSHIIMVNGQRVAKLDGTFKPGDKIQFVNTQPYARKIEGGGNASRPEFDPQSAFAPNGVYRAVYRKAKARYNKAAFIEFSWRQLDQGDKTYRVHSKKNKRSVIMAYPTISVRMLGDYGQGTL